MRTSIMIAGAASALALAGCQSETPTETTEPATTTAAVDGEVAALAAPAAIAMLQTADGQSVGQANITQDANGLNLMLAVTGMPPGNHGAHIHMTGQCDAPDFKSAGGHWNPTDKQHGLKNDLGSHMGDFINLEVTADGTGRFERPIANASLETGPNALLDADGAAFVVHAGEDDQITDPSGDSGARLACGVFEKTAS